MNAAEWAPAGVEVRIESQFPTVRPGSSTRVFTDQDFEERLQIPAVITTFLSCCLDDDSERGESRALLPFVPCWGTYALEKVKNVGILLLPGE